MIEFENWISTCRNPRVILNARGALVSTSCGHCVDCIARKMRRYTSLCVQESNDNLKTFFITLTYNDLNAPVVMLKQHKLEPASGYRLDYIDVTRRKLHPLNPNCKSYQKTSTYGQCLNRLNISLKNPLFKKFRGKQYKKSNLFHRRKFPHLYVLHKPDLQKFIKRLRFHIAKDFGVEVRYFAVGEYSPKHFRPHYHVILYVNEPRLYSVIADYVAKCWQYGITYCQPALTNNGTARYVASYTNCFTKLPRFFDSKKIAPFAVHSRYFGTQTNDEVATFIYSFDRYPFEPFDIAIRSGLRTVTLSSSLQSYLFPRCFNYVNEDSPNRLKLYTAYQKFCRVFKTESIVDICKYILLNPFKRDCHLYLLQLEMKPLDDFQVKVFYDAFECLEHKDDLDDYHIRLYNRLYTALLTSRHFYYLTQLPYFDGLGQTKRNRLLLSKIEDFYSQKDLWNLNLSLKMQEYYSIHYPNMSFDLFYPLEFHEHPDMYKTFVYDQSSIIKSVNQYKDFQYKERVKHKYLNDANDIFCNPLN